MGLRALACSVVESGIEVDMMLNLNTRVLSCSQRQVLSSTCEYDFDKHCQLFVVRYSIVDHV